MSNFTSPQAHKPTSPQAHKPTSPQAHKPTSPQAHKPTSLTKRFFYLSICSFALAACSSGGGGGDGADDAAKKLQQPKREVIKPAIKAPTDLKVVSSASDFKASWAKHATATAYNLYYAEQSFAGVALNKYQDLTGFAKLLNLSDTQATIALKDLKETKYYFVVTAIVGGEESGASNEFGLTNGAISNFKIGGSGNDVEFTWDAYGSTGSYEYDLYQAEATFNGAVQADKKIATIKDKTKASVATINFGDTVAATKRNLELGKTYYFVLQARDANGVVGQLSKELTFKPSPSFLNDTGITQCSYGKTAINPDSPPKCSAAKDNAGDDDVPKGQDGAIGTGKAGIKGMQFTKLKDFEDKCVVDEHTGLMWEVKQDAGTGLHSKAAKYYWYNPDSTTNGNDKNSAGEQSKAECTDTTYCDTQVFVAKVNAEKWCGFNDWRLPTVEELQSIVDYSKTNPNPSIDTKYFPNTKTEDSDYYLTSATSASTSVNVWRVTFSNGKASASKKKRLNYVRLVRNRLPSDLN